MPFKSSHLAACLRRWVPACVTEKCKIQHWNKIFWKQNQKEIWGSKTHFQIKPNFPVAFSITRNVSSSQISEVHHSIRTKSLEGSQIRHWHGPSSDSKNESETWRNNGISYETKLRMFFTTFCSFMWSCHKNRSARAEDIKRLYIFNHWCLSFILDRNCHRTKIQRNQCLIGHLLTYMRFHRILGFRKVFLYQITLQKALFWHHPLTQTSVTEGAWGTQKPNRIRYLKKQANVMCLALVNVKQTRLKNFDTIAPESEHGQM